MKKYFFLTGLLAFCLSACSGKQDDGGQDPKAMQLPENAPVIGASIKSVSAKHDKAPASADKPADEQDATVQTADGEYKEIAWEDLEIPGKGMDSIIEKYQDQIDSIPEGDPRDMELMKKMQAELNAAPVNPQMDGKKIKLPGFVTPLEVDNKKGIVKEFLLVPYFGACIHVPPPPVNQTLLVKPREGHTITIDESYDPVWVEGTIKADGKITDLAEAGYRILDAKVAKYEEDDATASQ